MSNIMCIPCINRSNHELVFHRHSRGKCSVCGNKSERLRQTLLVSVVGIFKECDIDEGCDNIKLQWVCKEATCPHKLLLTEGD